MKTKVRRIRREKATEILDVAFKLFSTKDYADVSMKEIADKSNSSYSLVYYYYESKDDIFYSSVRYAIEAAEKAYDEICKSDMDPVEAINRWLDINIEQSDALKRICKIMLEHSDRRTASPTLEKEIVYFYEFERGLLARSIQKGVDAGVFVCSNPQELAAFISTGIDGVYYGALTRPGHDIRRSIENLRLNIWQLLKL